jgi:hypothetical protein
VSSVQETDWSRWTTTAPEHSNNDVLRIVPPLDAQLHNAETAVPSGPEGANSVPSRTTGHSRPLPGAVGMLIPATPRLSPNAIDAIGPEDTVSTSTTMRVVCVQLVLAGHCVCKSAVRSCSLCATSASPLHYSPCCAVLLYSSQPPAVTVEVSCPRWGGVGGTALSGQTLVWQVAIWLESLTSRLPKCLTQRV